MQGLSTAINGKLLTTPPSSLDGAQNNASTDGPQKSMLEIKIMQTRAFERNPTEIVDGIKEFWANKGGNCSGFAPRYAPTNIQAVAPNPPKGSKNPEDYQGKYSYDSLSGKSEIVCSISNDGSGKSAVVKYELVLESIPFDGKLLTTTTINAARPAKKAIVRARYYGNNGQTLVLNEELYASHFKSLADALFVNAIALNPQEMQ